MPLIEGVGDEVTAVFGGLLILVILTIAWMSTRVSVMSHTSVVIVDRERFAELLHRVRGIATRTAAMVQPNPNSSPPLRGDVTSSEDSTEISSILENQDTSVDNATNDTPSDPMAVQLETPHEVNVDNIMTDNLSYCMKSSSDEPQVCEVVPDEEHPPIDSSASESVSASSASPDSSEDNSHRRDTPETIPSGYVQIRLQFVDGRQRLVYADPDETIGNFKRCHFASELANNSVVRFIAGGKELRDESSTLRSHQIMSSGAVLHCLVTAPRSPPMPTSSPANGRQFDIGVLMFPLFGTILGALWYARIMYRGYFNGTSTFSLLAISFLYVVAVLATLRGGSNEAHRAQSAHHPHAD